MGELAEVESIVAGREIDRSNAPTIEEDVAILRGGVGRNRNRAIALELHPLGRRIDELHSAVLRCVVAIIVKHVICGAVGVVGAQSGHILGVGASIRRVGAQIARVEIPEISIIGVVAHEGELQAAGEHITGRERSADDSVAPESKILRLGDGSAGRDEPCGIGRGHVACEGLDNERRAIRGA